MSSVRAKAKASVSRPCSSTGGPAKGLGPAVALGPPDEDSALPAAIGATADCLRRNWPPDRKTISLNLAKKVLIRYRQIVFFAAPKTGASPISTTRPAISADPRNSLSATVLVSGGLDSATALASIRDRDLSPTSLFVDYGQPARLEERAAAERIAANFGVSHRAIAIDGLFVSDGEIPGRNALLVLTAMMAAPAPQAIVLGVHEGTEYWDCSREFIGRMQGLLNGYAAGAVQLLAPFAALSKSAVYVLAKELGVDASLTYSCEHAGGPCGSCLSCKDVEALVR